MVADKPGFTEKTPFVDQRRVRDEFYSNAERLIARSQSLLGAKVLGSNVHDVVVELISEHLRVSNADQRSSWRGAIADLGCGRGSSSLALVEAFPSAQLVMVELSDSLLRRAAKRVSNLSSTSSAVRSDFHRLPLADGSCNVVVAAFCLYHSQEPGRVLDEIARSLDDDGVAILVTKSEDSYRELDDLVAASGLDPEAQRRPSLYTSVNSENLLALASKRLHVSSIVNEQHVFRFPDLSAAAVYLSTSPKYTIPESVAGRADLIEGRLRASLPEQPLQMTSTVTYAAARAIRRDA
jgi:SAM-dependent methyltransferase